MLVLPGTGLTGLPAVVEAIKCKASVLVVRSLKQAREALAGGEGCVQAVFLDYRRPSNATKAFLTEAVEATFVIPIVYDDEYNVGNRDVMPSKTNWAELASNAEGIVEMIEIAMQAVEGEDWPSLRRFIKTLRGGLKEADDVSSLSLTAMFHVIREGFGDESEEDAADHEGY